MPTVQAYETEVLLVNGIGKHSKSELDDAELKAITERFVSAHLLSNGISLPWTGTEVPLFHLTLWIEGQPIDNQTCNLIQSWIIRQFWLRKHWDKEIEIKIANL